MSTTTSKTRVAEIIAIVAAAGGFAVYLFTSTTGYLAGRDVDPLPLVLTALAVVALGADLWLRDRLAPLVRDLLLVSSVALLAWSFAIFILARVSLAADVYFIPVNYPAAEATTLHISFVGFGLYLIALVALIIEAFTAKRGARYAPVVLTAAA